MDKTCTQYLVRDAAEADLPAMLEIYNQSVADSTATFDLLPRTYDEQLAWFIAHSSDELPVFVLENNGRIIGWTSLSRYHSRCAYRQTVEPSIYVHKDYRRVGVGKQLMNRLMSAAAEKGYHAIVALICSENQASIQLALDYGFEPAGKLKEVGYKFDRWLDVSILQKML